MSFVDHSIMSQLDLSRTTQDNVKDFPIVALAAEIEEGTCLIGKVNTTTGQLEAQLSAGVNGEFFLGFALTNSRRVSTWIDIQVITVPVGGGTVALEQTTPVYATAGDATTVKASVMEGTTFWAVAGAQANAAAVDASKKYHISTGGVITFAAADAGKEVVVRYEFNVTAAQQRDLFGDRSLSGNASLALNQISAIRGPGGQVGTMHYDVTKNYMSAAGAPVVVYTGADGKVTTANTSGARIGIVLEPNTSENPFLLIMVD